MKIVLPSIHVKLFKTTPYYAWNFWHEFGWFADRDGSSLTSADDYFWMDTGRILTEEEVNEIKDFFSKESSFLPPYNSQKIVFDVDYKVMNNKIQNYLKNNPTLDVKYVGEGVKQVLYCSRTLTDEEKKKLKDLWLSMITVV